MTTSRKPQIVAFLDAMVFLHYRSIEELDWRDLLDADSVELLVTRLTMGEVDRHKDWHPSATIQERARRASNSFVRWFTEPGPTFKLREGVSVGAYMALPTVDFGALQLDHAVPDDRLIAAIMHYRVQNPHATVALVTQDVGPTLTARAQGIAVASLPSSFRLESPASAQEKRIRELQTRLSELEASMPEVELRIMSADGPVAFTTVAIPIGALEISEAEVEQEIQTQAKKHPPIRRPTGSPNNVLYQITGPLPEEYDRYARDREQYLDEYRKYVSRRWRWSDQLRRSFRIEFMLENVGTAPAEDIDLALRIPQGVSPNFDGKGLVTPPDRPDAPEPPQNAAQRMVGSRYSRLALDSIAKRLPSNSLRPPNVSDPFSRRSGDGWEVIVTVHRLKHNSRVRMKPIYLTFERYELVSSFGLEYTLRTANIPRPHSGSIGVKVVREEVSRAYWESERSINFAD